MHDGCSGSFSSAKQVVDKVRMMGFAAGMIPDPIELACKHCGETILMTTFEFACPHCQAVHAVTPCHAFSADHVQCAGVGY
jgi:Zn finger protein HypA/HybF involved in hydrogenase expression